MPERQRLGADIVVSGRQAEIWGVDCLRGSALTATDLRGGAALVIAALAAAGDSRIHGLEHLDRGYESLDQDLAALGAGIQRTTR